jgi:hypothetical protein
VETVEAFSSEHNESIETLLFEWPSSKFEALYEAYSKRKIADSLSSRRDREIAALWGNPNLDNEKDPELRQKLMDSVDEQFSRAIAVLYGEIVIEEKDLDWEDPFLAPAKKSMEKMKLPELHYEDNKGGDK